ncbi:nuclear-pore anchor isoform X1 [Syzygium oleosum]|uniref:nuclear-pore anchor isoform X1 n=1 Tax=Syzygium oleosum TaxID=219896 RepID=UPI0024BA76BA|nr:nuclear-pore anchor isoform X1 [Syzygium oleosum]
MPLFLTDDEFSRCSHDAGLVAEKADAFIRNLQRELDSFKAHLDASSITAEQTCSLLEQKYLSLSSDFSHLQSHSLHLQSSLDQRLSDLADLQSQKHHLHLQCMEKDGQIERLATEVSELHKSKRQLMELVEHKGLELSEKNATIKSYLDKIVSLTENASQREARLGEIEAELTRSKATCSRLSQEKELIERHNVWLNDELNAKVDSATESRRVNADLEADMSAKLADVDRQLADSSTSLNWNKERVRELETKLVAVQEELCSTKDSAAANEDRFQAEISTVNRLVELYKESSDEWSRKAGELEGVIKALETHLTQVENNYKEKLEEELSTRRQLEKEAEDLKAKLEKCEAEMESQRKDNESNLLPLSSFSLESWKGSSGPNDMVQDDLAIVPRVPMGVSGTALAASLLRDGWSLAKMYAKYQEAVDALRHEQMGRKEAEAVLQRVLYELEEKAEAILDERAEHERMVEAYSMINQRLQQATSEQLNLERAIGELKADLKKRERDYVLAQQEVVDLQKQVTVLLKECRDIQLRYGSSLHDYSDDKGTNGAVEMIAEYDTEKVISDRLLTFKDINGLVEQNVQLRTLVRSLSDQIENKELEFKEKLEMELKKQTEEAASKVAAVLRRAEEQTVMIESLHTSVSMYKRLYEEEHKLNSSNAHTAVAVPEEGRTGFQLLIEGSQEAAKKAQEHAAERVRCLEEELAKSRSKIILLQSERDKMALEAAFMREKLDRLMNEFGHKREEINGVLARNVEFSQLIVDYQRKVRESSESLHAAEELTRKLNMEVAVLKQEKEILSSAERRACAEVQSLSERIYRLQATLDTIQSTEEVREEARTVEKKRQEEYIQHIQKEWAEAKKELQEEHDNVRKLMLDRDQTLKNSMKQVEEMGKELASALHAVAAAETRAAVAEAKLSDLEKRVRSSDSKIVEVANAGGSLSISTNEVISELQIAKEEIEKLREEAQANKDHMLQYKSIAQVNESALKQMECAHENFKTEAERLKQSLEAEVVSLRERLSQMETEVNNKSQQVASINVEKEEALASVLAEITSLKEESTLKSSVVDTLETKISLLEDKWKHEHERWRSAQSNYERQVILQSETIQELTKTSEALASLQQETDGSRRLANSQKSENDELKARWEAEKSRLVESKAEAEKKYNELNEQNKILHDRLGALHIQLAERDRTSAGISVDDDAGLQNVINYLRRSKEIAETEISLLKQEKLRLQSQLESAIKAAETAQESLRVERASSRSLLFSEDEFKSLQLQVREISLLRESNLQLREENKHNFEECQKLREETQRAATERAKLENILMEKQIELEALNKEIETQRTEKYGLEKRVKELIERWKNIDVEHYNRLKNDVQQMQEKLKERDTQIEEISMLMSQKQDRVSQLEQDLEHSRLQLNEKEKRVHDILQTEEKHKRLIAQLKRKAETLTKEKEELIKESQALSKQLEESKQVRRPMGDNLEQVMKEKEEKEARIQILEKTVERQRDGLKKERERRQKIEETIMNSIKRADEEKTKVARELEKHKQVLRQVSDELEKLKHAKDSLPEGTAVIQLLSGNLLDDLASGYVLAIENFERVANTLATELGVRASTQDADASLAAAAVSSASAQATISAPETSNVAPKAVEEKERRFILPKPNIETRKTGRKLVRPRLKMEEHQDVEMTDAEGSNNGGKVGPPADTESNIMTSLQHPLRKRLASSASELHEQSQTQGEGVGDTSAPLMKKSKGVDVSHDAAQEKRGSALENLNVGLTIEESFDALRDLPQALSEEAVDEKEDTQVPEEKAEERESQQLEEASDPERKNDKSISFEEILNKSDDGSKEPIDQDNINSVAEFISDKEEGELIPDAADVESGGDVSNLLESPEVEEGKPEQALTPTTSPWRADDVDVGATVTDLSEINSSELPQHEKVEDGEITEETAEGSDKMNDGSDAVTVDIEQTSEGAAGSENAGASAEAASLVQSSSSINAEVEESKRASPASGTSTTINLLERARERAALRQAGVVTPPSSRGRARAVRGRSARGRGGRTGRGQGEPGQSSK